MASQQFVESVPLGMFGHMNMSSLAKSVIELAYDDNSHAHRKLITEFCAMRWDVPFAFLVAYLAMVFINQRKPRKACAGRLGLWVDRAFAAWNLSLSLFSFWCFYEMGAWTYEAVLVKGYWFTVCQDPFKFATKGTSHAALALLLFAFSKIPELGDTVFLILRGKPVRFLQWYHHSTVMLFCWLAVATEYTPGGWFAMTNAFVHAVMYMYFFLTAFKSLKPIMKVIAPMITIIQTVQMVYGLFINGFAVYSYFAGNYCHIQATAVYAAVLLYGSYFVLFSQLFLESQRSKAAGKDKKK